MRNKPKLLDPDFFPKSRKIKSRRLKSMTGVTQKGFSLDIALILILLLFGSYLYLYRKSDRHLLKTKAEQKLREIRNLNYQYFTNTS